MTNRPSIGDVLAGASVALILIPQSMAYAELAGLPPFTGLLAGALAPIFAAFFASSPYLQTGPVALTSLLTLGALSTIAEPQTTAYIALASLLAVLVGIVRVVLGLGRLGVVAYLMSEPVLVGFTSAAAVLILSSQLPRALGVTPPEAGVLEEAFWAAFHPDQWEPTALVLVLLTLVLMLGGRRLHPLFPGVLIAVVVGVAYSRINDYTGDVVGEVPARLPSLSFDLPWSDVGSLVISAVVIALVGFAEPASIARAFAREDRNPWNADREFVSQGVANLASGLTGGFPVGGSFSRSSINRLAGARTRWSGAVTGAVVTAFLPFAGILEPLPRAVLSGIVIGAVFKLIQLGSLYRLTSKVPAQALVGWSTFFATLAMAPRVERGVLIGIGLAVAVHLWRETQLDHELVTDGTTITVTPTGVFYFGSEAQVASMIVEALASRPDATCLVVDLRGVGLIDLTAARRLADLLGDARAQGVEVNVLHPPAEYRELFSPDGLA